MISFGRLLNGDYPIPIIPATHCHRHNADDPPPNGLAQAAESNRRRGAATRAAVLTAVHRGCSTIGDIAIDSGKAYSTVRGRSNRWSKIGWSTSSIAGLPTAI